MSPVSLRHRLTVGALAGGLGVVVVACGSSGGSSSGSSSGSSGGTVKVSVFEIAQADVITTVDTAFRKELTARLAPRKVTFNVSNANGDPSLIQSIARNLSRSDTSLIEVIGTPAVIAMAQQDHVHPIIALAMGDPVGGKVADSLDHPGHNVTGTIDYIDPSLLINELAKVSPAPKKIGTIYDPSNENSQVWVSALRTAIKTHPGMSLREATVAASADVQSAARSLVGRSDTILIGPDAAVTAGMAAVASVAKTNSIPLYLTSGTATTPGVLATLGPSYADLGSSAGDLAAKVVAGAKPADTPFGHPGRLEWDVNHATATALRVTLPSTAS